jgi:hypothetical protein
MQGGVLKSYAMSALKGGSGAAVAFRQLSFVQISDSHMGFGKAANQDVVGTLRRRGQDQRAPRRPEFMLHTATSPTSPDPRNSTPSTRS